jgi:hypothetical protein
VTYLWDDLVQNCLLKSVEAFGLQKVLFVFVQPSSHIALDRTALNNRLIVLVKFFLEIFKLFLDFSLSLAIQGFDARFSFFINTNNHSGSPSSICSLRDRPTAVLTPLF